MKFLLLIVAAIGAFAAAFIALLHISASLESTMPFWVAAALSAAVLSAGLFVGLSREKARALPVTLVTVVSFATVAAGDFFAAVFVTCSLGDCI